MPNALPMKLLDYKCIYFKGAKFVSHLLNKNLLINLFILHIHWIINFRLDTLYSPLYNQNLTLCMEHSSCLINIVWTVWEWSKFTSFLAPTLWALFYLSSEPQVFLCENLEGLDLISIAQLTWSNFHILVFLFKSINDMGDTNDINGMCNIFY